jgi:hypothetical protein
MRFNKTLVAFGLALAAVVSGPVLSADAFEFSETNAWVTGPGSTSTVERTSGGITPSGLDRYPDPVIPLMEPLDFPWGTIEGIWEARTENGRMLFSFEVRGDGPKQKFLRVLQIDPRTNEVVAHGTGMFDEKTKQVRAGMISVIGNSYMVFIGLYENRLAGRVPIRMTILTIRSFENFKDEFSLVVEKIVPFPVKEPTPSFPH